MSAHRVVLELSDQEYERLCRFTTSGGFASESDAITDLLLDYFLAAEMDEVDPLPINPSLREDFCAAYDEDLAHPEAALTSSELDAYLAQSRMQLPKAG